MSRVKMMMLSHCIHCFRVKKKNCSFVLLSLDGSAACHKINILFSAAYPCIITIM